MIKRISGFLSVVVAAALLPAFFSGCSNSTADSRQEIPQPVEQTATERRFVELPTEVSVRFGVDEDLFYPEEVRVASNGDVYISIGKAGKIHKYSPSGELLQVFGKGPGSGPGEFNSIRNFGIDPDGRVWANDPRQRRFTIFGPDGELELTFKPISYVSQIINSVEGPIGYYGFKSPFFSLIDSDGRVQYEFGTLTESADEVGAGLLFVGYLKSDPSGEYFVYVPMNNGKIVSYDAHGNLRFYRHSLGGPVELDVIRGADGNLGYDYERTPLRFQQMALNVWDGVLYIMIISDNSEFFFMDAYSANNGDYLYSMKVPMDIDEPCGPDFVTDTTIYMLCDSATSLVAKKRVDI